MNADETRYDAPYEDESAGGVPEFLLDPVGVARRRWVPAAAIFAFGIVATIVVAMLWVPSYVAVSTILITSQQIPEDFVRSTVETDDLANVNAMLGEVLSVQHLATLIDRFELFPHADPETPRIALVQAMRSRIGAAPQKTVSRQDRAIVFELSYEADDPKEASEVSNALAGLFVDASIKRRNSQARRATSFLRGEMERVDGELKELSREITEFRRQHRGQLPDEQDGMLRKLDALVTQRESLTAQIVMKEDRILSISSQSGDAVLSEDEILLAELRRQMARESAIHTHEHPNVIALRDRIDRLEERTQESSRLSPTAEHMIQAERREIARMRQQRERVHGRIADLEARLDRAPLVAEELAALERKEAVLREDYVRSLRKVQDAELAESLESAQQGGQVSILDPASPPTSPMVSLWLLVLAGLGASIAAAVGSALLLELVDPVLVGSRQIETLSSGPVLGTVPNVG